jgi:hypothetical protein
MLVSPDDTAVYMVQFPIQLAFEVGLWLVAGEDVLPQSVFSPAIETARNGLPLAIVLWHVAPGCACSENPEDAVDDDAVVKAGTTDARCLGRQQWLQTLPLGVSQLTTAVN